MAAVDRGISIDTSMGFTPLEGLLMGTRSGDIDPSVILFVMGKEGLALNEATTLLNKHSGLQGISGVSSDMREVIAEMKNGDKKATNAFDVFTYRVKKYIGAYARQWEESTRWCLRVGLRKQPGRTACKHRESRIPGNGP